MLLLVASAPLSLTPRAEAQLLNFDTAARGRLLKAIEESNSAKQLYDRIHRDAEVATDEAPDPPERMPSENPNVSNRSAKPGTESINEIERIKALGWEFVVTEDPAFAKSAAEYLLKWSQTVGVGVKPGDDYPLLGLAQTYRLIKPALAESDSSDLEEWFRNIGEGAAEGFGISDVAEQKPEALDQARRAAILATVGALLNDRGFTRMVMQAWPNLLDLCLPPREEGVRLNPAVVSALLDAAIAMNPGGNDELFRQVGSTGISLQEAVESLTMEGENISDTLRGGRDDRAITDAVERAMFFDPKCEGYLREKRELEPDEVPSWRCLLFESLRSTKE